jgi:hypothetical protein
VYALAAAPLPGRIRAGGFLLSAHSVGRIAIITGPPRGARFSIEEALRRQHAIVLALAEQIDPLLPARFGSRATAARLEALLAPSAGAVLKALDHVRGGQQMTLRLLGPSPRSKHPPPRSTTGTAYLSGRYAATRVIPPEMAPLEAAVRRFVVDTRIQPGRGSIRTTVFHLVRRGDVSRYRIAVESAIPAIAPWRVAVSGPWPPFAFAPELTT